MSPDSGEFQKVRIHVSPDDWASILQWILVVSVNESPHCGATDSEETRRIQGNANRAQ
jgi:hypothetical protein